MAQKVMFSIYYFISFHNVEICNYKTGSDQATQSQPQLKYITCSCHNQLIIQYSSLNKLQQQMYTELIIIIGCSEAHISSRAELKEWLITTLQAGDNIPWLLQLQINKKPPSYFCVIFVVIFIFLIQYTQYKKLISVVNM